MDLSAKLLPDMMRRSCQSSLPKILIIVKELSIAPLASFLQVALWVHKCCPGGLRAFVNHDPFTCEGYASKAGLGVYGGWGGGREGGGSPDKRQIRP